MELFCYFSGIFELFSISVSIFFKMSEALNSSIDGQENVHPNVPNASGIVDSSKPAVVQNLLSLGGGDISSNSPIQPIVSQNVFLILQMFQPSLFMEAVFSF